MALKDAEFVKDFCGFKTTARVYEAARLNLIPCVRIGRQVRFDEDVLREWVQRGGCIQPKDTEQKGKSL